jgi:hypothetical protein
VNWNAIITIGFVVVVAVAWYFWPRVTDGPNW